jgi:hypothetical protein
MQRGNRFGARLRIDNTQTIESYSSDGYGYTHLIAFFRLAIIAVNWSKSCGITVA